MNHYQKLATLIVRSLGLLTIMIGFVSVLYALGSATYRGIETLVGALFYVIVGVVAFAFSRRLGNLVGRGLDD